MFELASILISTCMSIVDVKVAHRSKRGFFKKLVAEVNNIVSNTVSLAGCIRKYDSILIWEKVFSSENAG